MQCKEKVVWCFLKKPAFFISIHEITLSLQGLIKLGFKVATDTFYVDNPDSMNS